jgi:hypothetical protein
MPGTAYSIDAQLILGRAARIGSAVCGVIGVIVGPTIGLTVYPPTAAFAMAELGIPAIVVGGTRCRTRSVVSPTGSRRSEVGGVPQDAPYRRLRVTR